MSPPEPDEMIAVIACAGRKRDVGFLTDEHGVCVNFVGCPEKAPADGSKYVSPDSLSPYGVTWRAYVAMQQDSRLVPAYQLYADPIYQAMFARLGHRMYILSAGWGLIAASFGIPNYDITYSLDRSRPWTWRDPMADELCRNDFAQLPNAGSEMVFFGGAKYRPRFAALSQQYRGRRCFYHRSDGEGSQPRLEGCEPLPFRTCRRTNWHYECARKVLALARS